MEVKNYEPQAKERIEFKISKDKTGVVNVKFSDLKKAFDKVFKIKFDSKKGEDLDFEPDFIGAGEYLIDRCADAETADLLQNNFRLKLNACMNLGQDVMEMMDLGEEEEKNDEKKS